MVVAVVVVVVVVVGASEELSPSWWLWPWWGECVCASLPARNYLLACGGGGGGSKQGAISKLAVVVVEGKGLSPSLWIVVMVRKGRTGFRHFYTPTLWKEE